MKNIMEFKLIEKNNGFQTAIYNNDIFFELGLFSATIGSLKLESVSALFASDEFKDIVGFFNEYQQYIDYANIRNLFFNPNGNNKKDFFEEKISLLFNQLFYMLHEALNTGHLSDKQLDLICRLFTNDFCYAMCSDTFKWDDSTTFIPIPLYDEVFQQHLRGLLLRDTSFLSDKIQKEMNNLNLTMSINIENGKAYSVFHLTTCYDFLLLDLQKYLEQKRTLIECKNCKRLFFPFQRSSAKYCHLPHKETDKTCDYLSHLHHPDIYKNACNKAKKYQARFRDYDRNKEIYTDNFLVQAYDDWKSTCELKCIQAELAQNLQGFIQWTKDTRFTRKYLNKLYQEYLQKKDASTTPEEHCN